MTMKKFENFNKQMNNSEFIDYVINELIKPDELVILFDFIEYSNIISVCNKYRTHDILESFFYFRKLTTKIIVDGMLYRDIEKSIKKISVFECEPMNILIINIINKLILEYNIFNIEIKNYKIDYN